MFAEDCDGCVITGALLTQGLLRKPTAKILVDVENRAG